MEPMLSVAILNDLHRHRDAGGHVKTWERFAEAATALDDQLELTLYFQGEQDGETRVAQNVRYVTLRPVLSTERIAFLTRLSEHTDLARLNRRLFRALRVHDVFHTTHAAFTQARTALAFARRHGTALVDSVHTDVPRFARIYGEQVLERMFGTTGLAARALRRIDIPGRRAHALRRRIERHWRACAHVLVSQTRDFEHAASIVGAERVSYLGRGIDRAVFAPERADRRRLARRFGVPPDTVALLFVGRVDPSKSVLTFAHAVRALRERGHPVHALLVGRGNQAREVSDLLGEGVSMTGPLPQSELGWIYASCDLLVFPSRTETFGNVVLEAQACGLPAVVADEGGAPERVRDGVDGIVVRDPDPGAWTEALDALLRDDGRRARLRRGALEGSGRPTWRDVLETDLLPVWRDAVRRSARVRGPSELQSR
ncbi:MAG: glycosyltransferase [Gemmatimonadetes bacterium]|nr:MAG: glycosyltransferase [Gemmatimonadota bacterium]